MRKPDTPDFPEPGWAETLDPDSVDYLYTESRARLLEQIGGIDAVSGKPKRWRASRRS